MSNVTFESLYSTRTWFSSKFTSALDTYEYEVGVYTTDRSEEGLNDPLLEELITREDIIVTPHIAFYTEEAIKHLIFDALDATMEVLNTGTTQLRVN